MTLIIIGEYDLSQCMSMVQYIHMGTLLPTEAQVYYAYKAYDSDR